MVERPEVIKLPIGPFALMWAAISTVFGFIDCYISGAISSAIYNWLVPRIGTRLEFTLREQEHRTHLLLTFSFFNTR